MLKILEDDRRIVSVTRLANDEDSDWTRAVDRNGVTMIEVYAECDGTPWVAIWKGNFLYQRISVSNLLIEYGEI